MTNEAPAVLSEIFRDKQESSRKFFDLMANERSKWIRRHSFYHQSESAFFKFHIPPGKKVLEIGCGTGYMLNELKPALGVGIDFSHQMLKVGKETYPDLHFIQADAHDYSLKMKADYIILTDSVRYFRDIQRVFKNIRQNCDNNTRIVVTNYNYLWEPILKFSESWGLKISEPNSSWLNMDDLLNLFHIENFDIVKSGRSMLLPIYLPIISWLANKYLAKMPLLNHLNLKNYIVARAMDLEPRREKSVTIVVPARNESGNIENAITRMPRFGKSMELIFIEGGSQDDTYDEIERVAKKYSNDWDIKFGRQEGRGKGDAVRKGYDMATGEILFILDADLTVPPEDLPKFYEALVDNRGEFINGTRLVYPLEKGAMRALNLLGNKFFSIMFSWLLEQRFKDTLCGTKVMSKKNYEILKDNRGYFGDFDPFGDFDLLFGSAKMDLKIVEVPIRYQARIYGDTNISRFSHGWLLLKMCFYAMRKIKFI